MKLYLCGITNAGNEKNLKELIEPVLEYFDGLVWTFHLPADEGHWYLQNNKKEGKIITAEWSQRHGYSMTHYLWQGPMQEGDIFLQIDSQERISPKFCEISLPKIIEGMELNDIGMVSNFGKGFIYRYNEALEFRGSPHWFAINTGGKANAEVQLDKTDFWNVRDEQREPFQFINHYLKYYLYPAGSNSVLLGLEKNGNPEELFPAREERRLKFRKYLKDCEIELMPEAVIDNMVNPSETMKDFINNEKILNDTYRYYILEDKDFSDDHDFDNMIKVE